MAIKNEQKEVSIQVGLPDQGHKKTMFFNRFRVQKEEGFRLVHFGLESESEGLLDSFSCVISDEALRDNQHSVLGYLGKVGSPEQKPILWNKPCVGQNVGVVDILNVSCRGENAETVLSVYSQNAAMRVYKSNAASRIVNAEHIALLRSKPETQKQVIAALYGE